tara:strand:- start:180 stop:656 length:477 start_codon:yes stop_codon:yes gene_type:complete
MIIVCPSCKKKFEVDEGLIPEKGRLLKCGTCNEAWFFNKNDQLNFISPKSISINQEEIDNDISKYIDKKNETIKKKLDNLPNNKGTEIIKYKPKSSFTIGKVLRYFVVSIITFIAVIIILDTFKDPLGIFFPNLEMILYNLFETLIDLLLFGKDLILK